MSRVFLASPITHTSQKETNLGSLIRLTLLHEPQSEFERDSVIFVNENENGEKRENNEFVNEN